VLPVLAVEDAVMVEVPSAIAVARPLVLLIVATAIVDESHMADAVRSLVEPSE
jgi:hypothetical protein